MAIPQFRREAGLVFGGVAPIAVAAALVGVRDSVQNANIALVLMVVVVLAAALGGRAAGAVSALTGALSFVFFHTRPYLRLTIDSADDVETAVLLLAVGLIVGTLVSGSWRARASAEQATSEIRRIHRVAEQAARGEDAADVILAAQDELADLLQLQACRFEAQPFTAALPRLERSGLIETRVHRFRDNGFELPPEGVELPVYGRGQQLGRFVLDPTVGVGVSLDQRVVAVALADQVGAALVAPLVRNQAARS